MELGLSEAEVGSYVMQQQNCKREECAMKEKKEKRKEVCKESESSS